MSKREIDQAAISCRRCKGTGIVVMKGSMWWQDRHLRCAYCWGTGRVKA